MIYTLKTVQHSSEKNRVDLRKRRDIILFMGWNNTQYY